MEGMAWSPEARCGRSWQTKIDSLRSPVTSSYHNRRKALHFNRIRLPGLCRNRTVTIAVYRVCQCHVIFYYAHPGTTGVNDYDDGERGADVRRQWQGQPETGTYDLSVWVFHIQADITSSRPENRHGDHD
jgi:hypothetical protein